MAGGSDPRKGETYQSWAKRTGYYGPQPSDAIHATWTGLSWESPKSTTPKPPTTKPPVTPPKPPAAPGSGAPTTPTTLAPGGGGPVVSAAKPVAPSMAGLQGGGGGDMGGGGMEQLSGPSRFRQGIGSRIPPQMSQSLAALRQIY